MLEIFTRRNKLLAPVLHLKCNDPITIVKLWGKNGSPQLQSHSNGCWMQFKEDNIFSHLVANDSQTNSPIGWEATDAPGLYVKADIVAEYIEPNVEVELNTLDGVMKYNSPTGGYICYNTKGLEKKIDKSDSWFVTTEKLKSLYTKKA